jgi:hypothetical protein
LIREEEGVAAKVLKECGLILEAVRTYIKTGASPEADTEGGIRVYAIAPGHYVISGGTDFNQEQLWAAAQQTATGFKLESITFHGKTRS